MRNVFARVLTLVLAILLPPVAATPTHAALPVAAPAVVMPAVMPSGRARADACTNFRTPLAAPPAKGADFGCLPSEKRVELLSRPPAPSLIAPLNRDLPQHRALYQWKAQEAAALAVPRPAEANPLTVYLESRDIESRRSEALKETRQAILRAEARILHLGTELNVATVAAAQWIQRQPGRAPPAAYLQRIVAAADAIRSEELLLKAHGAQRDALNRHFDEQLQQVLPLQG